MLYRLWRECRGIEFQHQQVAFAAVDSYHHHLRLTGYFIQDEPQPSHAIEILAPTSRTLHESSLSIADRSRPAAVPHREKTGDTSFCRIYDRFHRDYPLLMYITGQPRLKHKS
jgi:hypothetical protein